MLMEHALDLKAIMQNYYAETQRFCQSGSCPCPQHDRGKCGCLAGVFSCLPSLIGLGIVWVVMRWHSVSMFGNDFICFIFLPRTVTVSPTLIVSGVRCGSFCGKKLSNLTFQNVIYSCDVKTKFSAVITPVLSVTWFFRKQYNMQFCNGMFCNIL